MLLTAPVRAASHVVAAPVVEVISNSLRAACPVFPLSILLLTGLSSSSIRSRCRRSGARQSCIEDNLGVDLVHDLDRHGVVCLAGFRTLAFFILLTCTRFLRALPIDVFGLLPATRGSGPSQPRRRPRSSRVKEGERGSRRIERGAWVSRLFLNAQL